MVTLAALAISLTLVGCASVMHPAVSAEAAADAWPTTIATVYARVATNNFDGADSALAQFARQYPGTPAATETRYWHALLKADPANKSASLPAAMVALNAYLADTRPREHVTEATTFRRVVAMLDSMNQLAASALAQVKDARATVATANAAAADANAAAKDAAANAAAVAVSPATAEEIKHLKDELAKANAELERIRKRLSQPSKP